MNQFATRVQAPMVLIDPKSIERCFIGVKRRIQTEQYHIRKIKSMKNPDVESIARMQSNVERLKIIKKELGILNNEL
jgi:hypothetical protein